MRTRTIIFTLILLLLPVAYAGDYMNLTYPNQYYQEDGMHWTYCNQRGDSKLCTMYMTVNIYDNATNYSITWDAHLQNATNSSHWYWVDFESYVHDFTIYANDSHANGTANWSQITAGQSIERQQGLAEGDYQYRKYTFNVTETAVDLIPTYWVNDTDYVTYSQYAVFTSFDFDGNMISYVDFEKFDNINASGNMTVEGGVTWFYAAGDSTDNWRNSSSEGIKVNGTYGQFLGDTTSWLKASESFSIASYLTNDTATVAYYVNYTDLGDIAQIVNIQHEGRVFNTRFLANGSYVVTVRDAAFDEMTYTLPFDLTNGSWIHVAHSVQDTGAGVTVTNWVDGNQVSTNTAGNIDDFWTDTCSLLMGTTSCNFGATLNGNKPFNGGLDEFRMYNTWLDQTAIQELMNVRGTDPAAAPPTFTQDLANATLHVGSTYNWTLNVTSDNDWDVSSNDTDMTVAGNNVSGTVTVTYTPSVSGSRVPEVTVSNGDGSDTTSAAYTTFYNPPTYVEDVVNATVEVYSLVTFTLNLTAENDFDFSSNSSNVTGVANNGTYTVDVSYVPSTVGSEAISFTVSNADGSDVTSAVYTVTAQPVFVGTGDKCENVSDSGSAICNVMNGAGSGMGSLVDNIKTPVSILVFLLGLAAASLLLLTNVGRMVGR